MSWASMLADVYTLTKRPDLTGETELALKSATLQMHSLDLFKKDLFETGIAFSSSEYVQQLAYITLIPRWKRPKYLRKYDAVDSEAGTILTEVLTESVLDGYGVDRTNIYYLAGSVIQIKSSTQEQYYLLGAYLHPSIEPTNYISWIADEYPYAIVYKAASIVLNTIGDKETSTAYENESRRLQGQFVIYNLDSQ